MPDYENGIISVQLRHPTEDRELEVKINAKDMGGSGPSGRGADIRLVLSRIQPN